MNVLKNGTPLTAEIVELSRDFLRVDYCGKVYRIDFDRYPYFRSCFLHEIYNVYASACGLHWPDANIELEIEYIENPPEDTSSVDENWWKEQRKHLLSRLGAVGGLSKSPRKSAASRLNGAKGGRPHKKRNTADNTAPATVF